MYLRQDSRDIRLRLLALDYMTGIITCTIGLKFRVKVRVRIKGRVT
jgi:hypothetical protein